MSYLYGGAEQAVKNYVVSRFDAKGKELVNIADSTGFKLTKFKLSEISEFLDGVQFTQYSSNIRSAITNTYITDSDNLDDVFIGVNPETGQDEVITGKKATLEYVAFVWIK
jgi:hypothetical protein